MPIKRQWLKAIDECLVEWQRRTDGKRPSLRVCALCVLTEEVERATIFCATRRACDGCIVSRIFGENCTPAMDSYYEEDSQHAITSLILLREIVETENG